MKIIDKQKAFTLIEMAVVLSVIGLLFGTALKGTTLIERAQAKRMQMDFERIRTAVLLYEERFKTLPGDDANAINHVGGELNGNGNSQLEGAWTDVKSQHSETVGLWHHLERSGFLTLQSSPIYAMVNVFGAPIGIQSGLIPPIASLNASMVMCSAGISGQVALELDTRMDDGNTASGNMMIASSVPGTYSVLAVDNASTKFSPAEHYTVCMRIN